MTEQQALIAAIVAQPADDTARLVYADWLQEHGEEDRAGFIRAQVELACTPERLPPGQVVCAGDGSAIGLTLHPTDNPRHEELRVRSWSLLRANVGEWFGAGWVAYADSILGEHRVNHLDRGQYDLRRGFVASVTCPAEDWFRHADAILAEQPVEHLTLTTVPERHRLRDEFLKMDWMEAAHRVESRPIEAQLKGIWPRLRITLAIPAVDIEELEKLPGRRIVPGSCGRVTQRDHARSRNSRGSCEPAG